MKYLSCDVLEVEILKVVRRNPCEDSLDDIPGAFGCDFAEATSWKRFDRIKNSLVSRGILRRVRRRNANELHLVAGRGSAS